MSDIVERLKSDGAWLITAKHASPEVVAAGNTMLKAAHELTRLRSLTEWRPIETAPRDGTRVLGYQGSEGDHKGRVALVWRWNDGKPFWSCADYPGLQPTRWLPLPPPPNEVGVAPAAPSRSPASERSAK